MNSLIELADEVIAEDLEVIEELIKEEIQPLIDYRQKLEKKIFDKALKEVLELEAKV